MRKCGWHNLVGNNLTVDNFYTSLDLVKVCDEKKMTVLGTMRSNRKGVHKEMVNTEGREDNSTIVYFEKESGKISLTSYMVSTKSKGKKCVLLLSNYPDFAALGVTRDDGKKKSSLFKLYDYSMGGVDIVGK